MDWPYVHKIWERSISTNVGSGQPLKAALLLNYDPNGPSRLMSTIAEQEGIKADPTEMCELVSFVKRNKLQTEIFVIGQNQYLVTSIHESWFCARSMNTSKPSGEGAILMNTGAFLLIGLSISLYLLIKGKNPSFISGILKHWCSLSCMMARLVQHPVQW